MTDVLDRPRLPLEAGKIAELARALRTDSLPPTYPVLAAHHTAPGRSPHELVIAAAGLDPARVLLGSMEWVHHRRPAVGTVLTGEVRLLGTETKESRRAGTLRIATGGVLWRDTDGPVAEVRSTLLEPTRPPVEPPDQAGPDAPPDRPDPEVGPAAGEAMVLSRTDIVRYAGAAGDFNPVHHDPTAARALGYPDVFAMGLLPGGILAARLVGALAGVRLTIAFRGIVRPGIPYAVEVADGTASLRGAGGRVLVEATLEADR